MAAPAPAPAPTPTPAPTPPYYVFEWARSPAIAGIHRPPSSRISPNFSPPLIAMVAVLATAFLIVLYARILSRHLRRWRRRRRLLRSTEPGSPPSFGEPFTYSDYFLCPYGLDDSAIRTLPLSLFSSTRSDHIKDCVVCLLEFEPGESLRTLPLCAHAFHVSCIDVWLRSHATCPLCRAVVFRLDSPFVPMRAARIRRSLDDDLLLLEAAAPPEIGPGPGGGGGGPPPPPPAPAPRLPQAVLLVRLRAGGSACPGGDHGFAVAVPGAELLEQAVAVAVRGVVVLACREGFLVPVVSERRVGEIAGVFPAAGGGARVLAAVRDGDEIRRGIEAEPVDGEPVVNLHEGAGVVEPDAVRGPGGAAVAGAAEPAVAGGVTGGWGHRL